MQSLLGGLKKKERNPLFSFVDSSIEKFHEDDISKCVELPSAWLCTLTKSKRSGEDTLVRLFWLFEQLSTSKTQIFFVLFARISQADLNPEDH